MSGKKDGPSARLRHQLRTPLHQIIGYAELIEEEARDAGHQGYLADLARIRTAARDALQAVEQAVLAIPPASGSQALDEAPGLGRADGGAEPLAPPAGRCAAEPEPLRLLVVDDDEDNRQLLSRRLGGGRFLLETAADGETALALLAVRPFDLVLLDVVMPGLDGLQVLEKVRERWSESDLPVIMATARDAPGDVVRALGKGANDYVTKPFDFPVVLARIETQLTLRRQKQEIRRLAEDLELRNGFIRSMFGRYLSDEVVAGLLASPEGPVPGGENRKLTLLMSDLRGFTLLTEGLPPQDVLRLLNSYLGAMADVILAHQGMIDEFVGDAILAIFGAPLSRPDDARRAVACAVEMQAALAALNRKNAEQGLPRLEMGVAVHTGELIVGNIGSLRRLKYGVVGSAVNHTGRIESVTVGGQVLISEATLRDAGEGVRVGARVSIDAKGTRDPIVVYDLRGLGESLLPDAGSDVVTLQQPLEVLCHVVAGKKVEPEAFSGRALELSMRSATLLTARPLRVLTNLKLDLRPPGGGPLEIYAKVVQASVDGSTEVRFTSLAAEAETWLKELLDGARCPSTPARST